MTRFLITGSRGISSYFRRVKCIGELGVACWKRQRAQSIPSIDVPEFMPRTVMSKADDEAWLPLMPLMPLVPLMPLMPLVVGSLSMKGAMLLELLGECIETEPVGTLPVLKKLYERPNSRTSRARAKEATPNTSGRTSCTWNHPGPD